MCFPGEAGQLRCVHDRRVLTMPVCACYQGVTDRGDRTDQQLDDIVRLYLVLGEFYRFKALFNDL